MKIYLYLLISIVIKLRSNSLGTSIIRLHISREKGYLSMEDDIEGHS